jgi:hypothetical protein
MAKLWDDWLGLLPFVFVAPSVLLSETLGLDMRLVNQYLVNGLLGALLFGGGAALWQFAVKKYEK